MIHRLIACDKRLQALPFDDVVAALAEWELRSLPRGAVLMVRDNEVHVAAPPQSRGLWLSRKVIKEQLEPLLREYGFVVTSVLPDNSAGHAFVQRLGFEPTGAGRYVLKELNHA